MVKVKLNMCNNCNHVWVEPISVINKIIDLFKIKLCPMCKTVYVKYNATTSAGPR